jgi:hypothetical protein
MFLFEIEDTIHHCFSHVRLLKSFVPLSILLTAYQYHKLKEHTLRFLLYIYWSNAIVGNNIIFTKG